MCVLGCSLLSDSLATPWSAARQAPLSMGVSRQEHWSGLPFPPPGDLPDPGIEPASDCLLHWQADSLLARLNKETHNVDLICLELGLSNTQRPV